MIFRQAILKEEKIKFLILLCCIFVPIIAIFIISIIRQDDLLTTGMFLLAFFLPILLLTILLGLNNLEWFYIYDDRIEARCIYGIKNIVYFDKVLFVQELTINLTTRGMKKSFYFLNDGRKNNNSLFDINSCYNQKKNNLRIYKTEFLEEFITKNLETKVITN